MPKKTTIADLEERLRFSNDRISELESKTLDPDIELKQAANQAKEFRNWMKGGAVIGADLNLVAQIRELLTQRLNGARMYTPLEQVRALIYILQDYQIVVDAGPLFTDLDQVEGKLTP